MELEDETYLEFADRGGACDLACEIGWFHPIRNEIVVDILDLVSKRTLPRLLVLTRRRQRGLSAKPSDLGFFGILSAGSIVGISGPR